MISANSLSAAVQGQFMFVLPWMLLARGSSPQVAALATACIYVPMLVTAVPAGAKADNADPLRLMRWVTVVPLVVCAGYPLAVLAGRDGSRSCSLPPRWWGRRGTSRRARSSGAWPIRRGTRGSCAPMRSGRRLTGGPVRDGVHRLVLYRYGDAEAVWSASACSTRPRSGSSRSCRSSAERPTGDALRDLVTEA